MALRDPAYQNMLLQFLSQKYGVPPASFEVRQTPTGILGYYHSGNKQIVLRPDADAEVLVHEFFHSEADAMNRNFPDDAAEHVWVWEKVREEMNDLGMPLKTYEAVKWSFISDQNLDGAGLEQAMIKNQEAVGINIQEVETRGNEMLLTFTPTTTAELTGEMPPLGVKPIAPIIWGVLGLASLVGIAFTAWQVQEITQQMNMWWVGPVAVMAATAGLIYVVSKI